MAENAPMTHYPPNTNPLCGPNWRQAITDMLNDADPIQTDCFMIDIEGDVNVSAIVCLIGTSDEAADG